ncbi:MAG: hypothetical protein PHC88_00220 [Terrimicrobiaceae bacterium]|nr:hypothetical protein [Terrimicrobiaceae bacterium]
MTPEEHTEAWRNNIKSKAQEIQGLLNEVIGLLPMVADEKRKSKFEERLQTVTAKARAMHDLYGPNLAPQTLQELTHSLTQWKSNLQDHNVTRKIAELWQPIGKLNGEEEISNELSFSAILEKHNRDGTLQKCLEELISSLEKLLAAGDDTLTKQAATELERILAELKKRKNESLFDIQPWIEFALVSTGAIVDHYTGTPIATIAAAALVAAKESQIQVNNLFTLAYHEYVESLKMKGQAKWEGIFGKKLKGASLEDIQKAIQSPDGLKSLPEPDTLALPPASSEQ